MRSSRTRGAFDGARIGCAALAASLSLAEARAESAEIPALRDNTLIESATGARSNGAGPVVFAGRTSQTRDARRRALVAFDVAGSVPAGVIVTDAWLELEVAPRPNQTPVEVSLHRVLADWGEGSSATDGGGGAPSTPGDATWIHTFYDDSLWARAGGDFAAASSAVAWVSGEGIHEWGSTPALVADVQAWLDAPEANHGWILIGDEEAASTARAFYASENDGLGAPPRLVVEYAAPCELSGARGVAFGLCEAYCEALDCDASAARPACDRLAS
ncbi:MAG TPA: DNRLRE domain-containing protein, partial [Myxococcota bacterium]